MKLKQCTVSSVDVGTWCLQEARCYARTATTAVESCWPLCRGFSSYSPCHFHSESVFGYDSAVSNRDCIIVIGINWWRVSHMQQSSGWLMLILIEFSYLICVQSSVHCVHGLYRSSSERFEPKINYVKICICSQIEVTKKFFGPIPWGHSCPLCHALSLSSSSSSPWTSMHRRRATR